MFNHVFKFKPSQLLLPFSGINLMTTLQTTLSPKLEVTWTLTEVVKSALKTAKHLAKQQAKSCDHTAYKKLYAACMVIRDWDKEVFLNE